MMDMKTTNAHSGMHKLGVALAVAFAWAGGLQAETLTWTGAESAVWDLTAVNWTNESGVATAWVNGSDALFTSAAAATVSIADDMELRNLTLEAPEGKEMVWSDGGGSLTFVTDEATPTNTFTLANNGNHCQMHARVVCTAPFLLPGAGVLRLHHANNTFQGGIVLSRSQLRFRRSGSLGSETVAMDAFGRHDGVISVFLDDVPQPAAPDVKFIQNAYAFMGSVNTNAVTVKGVGVTPDNKERTFGFGRSNDNTCSVTLSLTRPDSEGIAKYRLRGGRLRFAFDGGVVKAAPEARELWFTTPQNLPAPMTARVTNNGVTFDTAGANTELGLTLQFDAAAAATNVLETVEPANGGFESTTSMQGWTVNPGQNTGEGSSSQLNDSAFMKVGGVLQPDYFTTNGTRFAVVRRGHTISQSVTLPTAGLWRGVYERGCRPDPGYPSQGMSVTVSLGGQSSVSPEQTAAYPFRREATDLFELEAGPQTLSFAVSYVASQSRAVFLDAIRLERCEVTPIPVGPLVKTGAGSLAITNLVTDGLVAVSNGTLAVRESTLAGTPVEVASGGTLALYATKVTNATVNVASGGTLALCSGDGKNLVVNGSFELNAVAVTTGAQAYDPGNGPTGWTFDYDPAPVGGSSPSPGTQQNHSNMSSTYGSYTAYGQKTAYMRRNTTMSQTVEVPADGLYEVSFLQGSRNGYNSCRIPLTLAIDGTVVVSNASRTAYYDFERNTARVNLTAGEHTLTFATGYWSDIFAMLFVDDVRLTALAEANELEGNALAFVSGATLDLQNVEPIYLAGGVTVDGRAVKGTANVLRRAGVTVTGPGSIQIGPPQGTTIIIR